MSRNSSSSSWQDTGAASDGGWSNHAPVVPPPSSKPHMDHSDSWATQEASTASRLSPATEKATTGTFAGFEGVVMHAQWNHMLSICLQSTARGIMMHCVLNSDCWHSIEGFVTFTKVTNNICKSNLANQ